MINDFLLLQYKSTLENNEMKDVSVNADLIASKGAVGSEPGLVKLNPASLPLHQSL